MKTPLAKFPVALIAALAGIGVAIVVSTCALRLNFITSTSAAVSVEPMFGSESIHITILLAANFLGAITAGYVGALLLPDARIPIAVISGILFCVWATIEFLLPPAAFVSLGWPTVVGAVPAAIAGAYLVSKRRNVA